MRIFEGLLAMKFKQRRRGRRLLVPIAACSFCCVSLSLAATKAAPDPLVPAPQAPKPGIDFTRLRFSAGLLDIVKMVKAKVDPELIKTFISHYSISYNPSAQEVIALKRLGVPDDIVV